LFDHWCGFQFSAKIFEKSALVDPFSRYQATVICFFDHSDRGNVDTESLVLLNPRIGVMYLGHAQGDRTEVHNSNMSDGNIIGLPFYICTNQSGGQGI